jgi:hypothetical protein
LIHPLHVIRARWKSGNSTLPSMTP